MPAQPDYEGIVVGTGFGGLYALHLLKQLGLKVRGLESAPDVGGTWHWNRYPGARSDVTSDTYRYSNLFDKELLLQHEWPNNYLTQPELQAYFQAIARKHELYPLISFNTDLEAAHWDDESNLWNLRVSTGERLTTRYLATGIGILHKPNLPDIPGLDSFKGQIAHSSQWTPEFVWDDKKIAVIGSGASGVQLTSALSERAKELTHFIRHAQYVLPAQLRPVSQEERKAINDSYEQLWEDVFNSSVGFGFAEPTRTTFSVSPEEREKIFQDLWDQGSGFRFLFGGFSDVASNEEANRGAIKFIHNKIKETVKDPAKAEVLLSNDWFARRPLTDDNYYHRFTQDNIHAVDLKTTPITGVTPEGIRTADGRVHEVDLIVFATGFDAVDGSYFAIDFQGRDGQTLKENWTATGPRSHTGVTTAGFPNLFFVNGPGAPFANNPPVAEESARFAADLIARSERLRKEDEGTGVGTVESTREADEKWFGRCREAAERTLFSKTPSWFFGENVPGRTVAPRFFFGGIAAWRQEIEDVKRNGYAGFEFR